MKAAPLDPNLQRFATVRQWQVLSAADAEGTDAKAAEKLGIDQSFVSRCRQSVALKAARAGYMPGFPQFGQPEPGPLVPPGFVMKGQSALVDAAGNMAQRWDKTKQAGRDPEEAFKLPDPKKVSKL